MTTLYQNKLKEELLSHCAPSTQNNERKYWSNKIDIWFKTHNISIGRDLEERFDLSIDERSGLDHGNEPEPLYEE